MGTTPKEKPTSKEQNNQTCHFSQQPGQSQHAQAKETATRPINNGGNQPGRPYHMPKHISSVLTYWQETFAADQSAGDTSVIIVIKVERVILAQSEKQFKLIFISTLLTFLNLL